MHCGTLCDKDGNVKRTWSIVGHTIVVPIENGDYVIEWVVDHGTETVDPVARVAAEKAAIKEQSRMGKFRSKAEVLTHGVDKQRTMDIQEVVLHAPSAKQIHYGRDIGLHHRSKDADDELVETLVDPNHKLKRIR